MSLVQSLIGDGTASTGMVNSRHMDFYTGVSYDLGLESHSLSRYQLSSTKSANAYYGETLTHPYNTHLIDSLFVFPAIALFGQTVNDPMVTQKARLLLSLETRAMQTYRVTNSSHGPSVRPILTF